MLHSLIYSSISKPILFYLITIPITSNESSVILFLFFKIVLVPLRSLLSQINFRSSFSIPKISLATLLRVLVSLLTWARRPHIQPGFFQETFCGKEGRKKKSRQITQAASSNVLPETVVLEERSKEPGGSQDPAGAPWGHDYFQSWYNIAVHDNTPWTTHHKKPPTNQVSPDPPLPRCTDIYPSDPRTTVGQTIRTLAGTREAAAHCTSSPCASHAVFFSNENVKRWKLFISFDLNHDPLKEKHLRDWRVNWTSHFFHRNTIFTWKNK